MIPWFIGGNRHPTIPHFFKDDQLLGDASADTQPELDRGNGNRLYEVNIWMWRYGRGSPWMVQMVQRGTIKCTLFSSESIYAGNFDLENDLILRLSNQKQSKVNT
jgi:hypothetical protein